MQVQVRELMQTQTQKPDLKSCTHGRKLGRHPALAFFFFIFHNALFQIPHTAARKQGGVRHISGLMVRESLMFMLSSSATR